MNKLVEILNAWGGRFADAAWPMLWQSSVLIALVFALDMALRQRVRATTRYALWLLVLAKLVVPASFSLPTGVGYWVPAPTALTAAPIVASALRAEKGRADERRPAATPVVQAASLPQADLATGQTLQPDVESSLRLDRNRRTSAFVKTTADRAPTLQEQTTPAAGQTLQWRGVAALFWLAGMAGLAGVLVYRTRVTRRMLAGAAGTEEFSGMLLKCASRLGVRRRVTLKLSGAAAAPAVCGLFRPVILLPTALASRLSAAQMEAVLLHELAHVRRGDPWVNYIQALLQIFYFYNPLLWLANAAIRRVREEAVDELVLVAMADDASLYPETLLQVAKFTMQTARPGFGWVGILEKKSTVGGRIRLMLRRPWPQSARLGLRGGIAVAAAAAVLLPMSSRPQQQNPAPGVASSLRLDPSPAGNPSQQQLPSRPGLVPPGSPQVNALCAAIYDRRWPEALQMIDSGVPVNGVDEQRRTPLGCLGEQWYEWTAQDEAQGEAVLQKLLQHGADPFAPSASTLAIPNDDRPPIERVMDYEDSILGAIMLTNNPSPARRTPSGLNALQLAMLQGYYAPISKGETNNRKIQLYQLEMSQTRTNVIDFLLSHGFSADQTNADGLTLLQEMAWSPVDGPIIAASNPPPYFVHAQFNGFGSKRDAIIADLLLSRGATLDVFSAAGFGLTSRLAALLRADPKLANVRDRFGRTPLHYAACSKSDATALLLQAGADPAAQTTKPAPAAPSISSSPFPVGFAPLQLAIRAGNKANVQLLIKAGAPLAQTDADGCTPLHRSVPWRTDILALLISAGAPLDLTNHAGQTALRIAFDQGSGEDVELLLRAGARKDIGLENTTLLHIAASPNGDWQGTNRPWLSSAGREKAIPALVAAGLAVDARDGQGHTPFQLAVTALNLRAMGLLLTNGADINAVDGLGNTALHQLSIRPVDEVVTIPPGYMPAQRTHPSQMPTTNISLTAWLLEHGANPNLTNHDGQTPLDLLRAHKWTTPREESQAAARIALLLRAGAKEETQRNRIAPQSAAGDTSLMKRQDVRVIAIDADGGYWLDGNKLPLAQVEAELARMSRENPKLSVDITADRSTQFNKVIALADACTRNHITFTGLRVAPSQASLSVPSAISDVNALCAAIYDRRWPEALQMIDSGVPVNGVDEQRRTPLDCLVERWYMPATQDETRLRQEVLQKLLQHGADPFAASATTYRLDDVHSPVEKAMAYADTTLGHILLTNNASPVRRTPSGETALHLAVREGRTNIIDSVLSQGFSANQTNNDGLTPLQELAGLSPNGVFIPASNPNPPPYFMHAPSNSVAPTPGEKGFAAYADAIVADFLLSRGATLDVFSAAGFGLTNQLAALLRSNPKLANARDSFGRTPLHYAASGQSNTTALLLRAGADPAARTSRAIARKYSTPLPAGSTPLHYACSHENLVTAQLLVKAGAPLAQADAQGDTALHLAAYWGNTNLPKLLIGAGAPLDATNRAGQTPLRFAIQSGGSGNVEQLLMAGARKDVGLENTTLLHIAAAPNGEPSRNDAMPDASWRARGSARAIPALLTAGLAVDARDGQGCTPFQRAVTALNLAAMEMLLTNGADINAVDPHGDTALHQISIQAWDQVTPDISSQLALPVGQKTQSDQPVQQQARMVTMTNISVTAWLLEHGANPNLANHAGQTPLQLLQTHKWTNLWDERDAAARIPLLLKAGAKVRGENEPKSGPVPDPICVKLQALFQKYYPKATFTNSEVTTFPFSFEYEVGTFEVPADTKSGDAANPSGAQQRTERGPKKGGIMCDVLIQKGKDIGQLVLRDEGGGYGKFVIDRKVYKQHLMAPYSAKRDAHLWVRLLCPSDTSEDFLKEFDAIMTDFQKDVN